VDPEAAQLHILIESPLLLRLLLLLLFLHLLQLPDCLPP
jgi:hypothetical protein